MEYCESIMVGCSCPSSHVLYSSDQMAKAIWTSLREGCSLTQSTHSCSPEASSVSPRVCSRMWFSVTCMYGERGSRFLWETYEKSLQSNTHPKHQSFHSVLELEPQAKTTTKPNFSHLHAFLPPRGRLHSPGGTRWCFENWTSLSASRVGQAGYQAGKT